MINLGLKKEKEIPPQPTMTSQPAAHSDTFLCTSIPPAIKTDRMAVLAGPSPFSNTKS